MTRAEMKPTLYVVGGTGERPDLSRYRRSIERALAYSGGTHTYEDVVDMIADGRAMLWAGPSAMCVTEIIEYPRKRVLNIFLAGGDAPQTLAEMERLLPIVLDHAKQQGCAYAMFSGRRGWERTFLARTGWTFPMITARKEL